MSNRIIHARKQGRVFTVFIDQGMPQPIQDFETEPMGLPQTILGEEQLRAAYPGCDFKFIEEPRKQQEVAKRPSEADVQRFLKERPTSPAPVSSPVATSTAVEDQGRALQYYKILLAQENVAAQNKKEKLRLQVATCANLILAVWPNSLERLESAKEEMKGFTLG